MSASTSARLVRALPGLAIVAALALVSSQLLAWRGVMRAATTANRGEAGLLLDTLEAQLHQLGRRPEATDLEAFLAAHRGRGLRYVAVGNAVHRVEVGEGVLDDPRPPDRYAEGEARVRAISLQPQPPPWLAPRRNDDGRADSPMREPPRRHGPRRIIVEVAPTLGAELQADAHRSLIGSGLAAALVALLGITLHKSVRRREALAAQAEHNRRLAALGRMSAVLAHEIRNPLASLKGHAQLLAEALPSESPHTAKVTRIVGDALRLEKLTNNLLDFVRSDEIRLQSVDFADLVRNAANSAGQDRAELTLPPDATLGRADPIRFEQALVNVITNATQATDGVVRIRMTANSKHVTVAVDDDGKGIDDEVAATLFEPFQTTRARGTGLGLAIAKQVVESHGGHVTGANRREGGATFTIVVPRSAG